MIDDIIDDGNSGKGFLIILLKEVPENIIDFENEQIFWIDLDKSGSNFTAQVHHIYSKKHQV